MAQLYVELVDGPQYTEMYSGPNALTRWFPCWRASLPSLSHMAFSSSALAESRATCGGGGLCSHRDAAHLNVV